MAVGDLYQVAFHQTVHNVNCVNVFHFKQTGASSDDVPQLIQAFLDNVIDVARLAFAVEWVPLCVDVNRILPTEGSHRFGLIPSGNEGQDAGECMPANQVAAVTWYTSAPTKKGRGRTWFSGFAEEREGRNNLTQPGLVLLQDLASVLRTELVGTVPDGTWQLHVYSTTDETSLEVEAFEARSPFKKLRSRTPRIC